MSHPNISKLLKEQNYRELHNTIKRKEAQLQKKEADLKLKEEAQKVELE
jgi:hypothetical protein